MRIAARLSPKKAAKALRHPALVLTALKRFVLMGGVRRDRECMHMVYAWSCGTLPRVDLAELFPGIDSCPAISLRKPESRILGASVDLHELIHLIAVVKHISANRILEIGTFDGFTALNLAANLQEPAKVFTLDLPETKKEDFKHIANATEPSRVGEKFRGEPEESRIRQLRADSTTADWNSFGPEFDLILIDGCHEYSFVMSDSINAFKRIRRGGVILWHDYGALTDVSRAVDHLAKTHPISAIKGTRFACYQTPSPSAAL